MNDRQEVSNIRFATYAGIEVPWVTEAEMREADRIAVEETGPNLYQMMENAGRNLALQAMEMLGAGWERGAGKTFCIWCRKVARGLGISIQGL
jgi:hypothetical protein